MSLQIGTSVTTTADNEELDYEEDDVEEGEILDEDSEDYPNEKICEFFKYGRCQLGDQCPYLHVTDKGLYRMLEVPSPTSFPRFPQPLLQRQSGSVQPVVHTSNLENYEKPETVETDWDRALEEAKKLVKKWEVQVKRTSNPIVITLDTDDERPSKKKSSKKACCYKSPEPKVSVSDNVGRFLKRDTVESKNEKPQEVKWHDPWRRSPVRRTKVPVISSKIRQKKQSASSSSSECSSRWFRRRKQNFISIAERRRRMLSKANVVKRPKGTSRRSSSSSFSPTSVYRPIKDKKDTKLQPTKKEKKKSPAVENSKGVNSVTPTCVENSHKMTLRRSSSRSPTSTFLHQSRNEKTGPSVKVAKTISPTVENKFGKNSKENVPSNKDLSSLIHAYAEDKTIPRRSSSRNEKRGMSAAKEAKTISPMIENKFDKNSKPPNDPNKKDSFTHAYADNKIIHRPSSSRNEKSGMSAKEAKTISPMIENKFDKNSKTNDPSKKDSFAHVQADSKIIPGRSSSRNEKSETSAKSIYPTFENKFDRNSKAISSKKDLSPFTNTYAVNWHKTIPRRFLRSSGPTSKYQSRNERRGASAKKGKKISPFKNKYDRNSKQNESLRKMLPVVAYAENRYKTISRRSPSRSGGSLAHLSISDKSERQTKSHSALQEKNIFLNANNLCRILKTQKPVKKDLPPFIPDYAENRHKVTSRHSRSRSCSPASVYRSRNEKLKSGSKLHSTVREKSTGTTNAGKIAKRKECIEKASHPFSFSSARPSSDVRKWTPKKHRPPPSPVYSCSDMSISPLSDQELNDLFDPDKTANKLNSTRETNQSRTLFLPRKKHSPEVYGPICPQPSQPVAQSTLPAPDCATEKKSADLPKPRQQKKRNTGALEADLLKFQRRQRCVASRPIPVKNGAQRSAETKPNRTCEKEMNQTQKKTETKKNEPLVKRKHISRKDMLLKQLAEIDAVIEKRRQKFGG